VIPKHARWEKSIRRASLDTAPLVDAAAGAVGCIRMRTQIEDYSDPLPSRSSHGPHPSRASMFVHPVLNGQLANSPR